MLPLLIKVLNIIFIHKADMILHILYCTGNIFNYFLCIH
jgi:hypothetical protein